MKATASGVLARMALLIALMFLSVVSIATVSLIAFEKLGTELADLTRLQEIELHGLLQVSSAQSEFLLEMQEWQRLWTPGQDARHLEEQRAAFETKAADVEAELTQLRQSLLLPANQEQARVLLAAHAELGQKLRSALSEFGSAYPDSGARVDELVGGLNHALLAQFKTLLGSVDTDADQTTARLIAEAGENAASARRRMLAAFAIIALASLLVAWVVTRSVFALLKQQRASERSLKTSEARYRQLVEISPYVVLVECEGRWVFANAQAVAMFKARSVSDLLGREVLESMHPDARERVRERIRRLHANGVAGEANEERWLRLDGSSFPGEAIAAPFLHEGKPALLVLVRDITPRKSAEAQRDRFFTLSIDLLCIAGADGLFKRVNPAFSRTLGWDDAELLGRPFVGFVHPDDVAATLQEMASLAAGETTLRFENRYRCKDETWRWLAWNAVTDPDGMVYASARDLTASKDAEAALRASEEYNRGIVESSQDCLKVLSLDGRLLHMNASGRRLMGVSDPEQLRDAHWLDFWQGEERAAAAAAIATACSGETARFKRYAKTLDGQDKWWDVIVTPILGSDGTPRRLLGVSRDITLQRQAEEALGRINADLESRVERRTAALGFQQAFLRKVIDLNPSLIYAKDGEGRYVLLNEAVAKVYRSTVEAMLGKTDSELHADPAMADMFRKEDLRVLQGLSELIIDEERLVDPAGHVRWWSTVKRPITAPDGQGQLVLGVTTEITRRKAAEAELHALNADLERKVVDRTRALETSNRQLEEAKLGAEQASRAKSAFLATMSHEIRTPMNGVIGMVDVLAQSRLGEDQADAVAIIRTSAFSLLGIIDDILDFSKIEADRLELERSASALSELVECVCDTLQPMASAKGVALRLFIDPRVAERVWTDPTRLRQVLYNLVGNAIKFSANRPHVCGRVSLRVDVASAAPLRLAFSIADNGIGIATDALTRLFQPFVQAESTTTRRFGGTGLGLAISHRLVELMHGEIACSSAPGTGSTFTVTLPFEVVDEPLAHSLPDLAGIDCIVVASPDLAVEDLSAYLRHAGSVVHGAVDSVAAARLADARAALTGAPVVVIEAGEPDRAAPGALRAFGAGAANVHHLLIASGRHRRARRTGPNSVTLEIDGLRRASLLRAVAFAAGRTPAGDGHAQASQPLSTPGAAMAGGRKASAAPAEGGAGSARGQRILVAEDDETNQKVIFRQLALLGFAAEVAGDGAQALQLWRSGDHALLLTDLHMPEMDGYALAEAVRREEMAQGLTGPGRIPILALTANALREEAGRVRAAGMDDYLTKPIQLAVLRAALEEWLPQPGPAAGAPPAATKEMCVAPPTPVVDLAVLAALVGDDASTLHEFLGDYLHSVRPQAAKLRVACTAGDGREVAAIAHRLKSSSRSIGALAFGELCAELESAGGSGGRADLLQRLARFDTALSEVESFILMRLAPTHEPEAEPIR